MLSARDALAILETVKNKVLDAVNFERLRTAYEWLDENLRQITANNAALRESNDLLKEKVTRLEADLTSAQQDIAQLVARIPKVPTVEAAVELSQLAIGLVEALARADTTRFGTKKLPLIAHHLSEVQRQAAIDELRTKGILDAGGANSEDGLLYFFTSRGKQLLLSVQQKRK